MRLIIAEKPDMGKKIAKAIGLNGKTQNGFIEDIAQKTIITWAIGHLARLKNPEEYNPDLKNWTLADLPIDPKEFELTISPSTKDQLMTIKSLLKRSDVTEIVCATDAAVKVN